MSIQDPRLILLTTAGGLFPAPGIRMNISYAVDQPPEDAILIEPQGVAASLLLVQRLQPIEAVLVRAVEREEAEKRQVKEKLADAEDKIEDLEEQITHLRTELYAEREVREQAQAQNEGFRALLTEANAQLQSEAEMRAQMMHALDLFKAENAEMRALLARIAKLDETDYLCECWQGGDPMAETEHTPDCLLMKTSALLAAHPAVEPLRPPEEHGA